MNLLKYSPVMRMLFNSLMLSLIIFSIACDGGNSEQTQHLVVTIQSADLEAALTDNNLVLIDVRTPAEWEAGRVEGALMMNLHESGFREQISKLDRNQAYLLYCRTGNRSRMAAEIMHELGFLHIYNFDGNQEDIIGLTSSGE